MFNSLLMSGQNT